MWNLVKNRIFPYWKTFIIVLLPIALLPLLIISGTKEARAGYVIIIMAIFWMTEALPLAITSLIPVVFFPFFGIMNTGDVCTAYMKETNMMFVGGLIVALTIEYSNLHKRIALRVLLLVGSSPRWLMLGFMATTMFLSMWISNTATTAMMVPIVEAVIQELYKDDEDSDTHSGENGSSAIQSQSTEILASNTSINTFEISESKTELNIDGPEPEPITSNENRKRKQRTYQQIRTAAFMCVAYSSNIGGTGSLIGSSPQLALKAILNNLYGSATGLNFATWMAFNVPGMLINTFLAWLWLQLLFIGFKRPSKQENDRSEQVKLLIQRKYQDLGPITFHEIATLTLFIILVFLWFFRDPQFIPGWGHFIHGIEIDDATAAMAIVLLLFIVPAHPKFWCLNKKPESGPEKPSPALITWAYVQSRLPWGIVLLLGGGFALSDASKVSGLSQWLGNQLSGLQVLPSFAIMVIICIMTATITEVASNTATANILLPILAEMSKIIRVNPIYLMLPATVTCSYAFMLPVATPPNAIVFEAGKMKPVDMIKAGFVMNIVCVVVICVLMETLGNAMFNIYEYPSWAEPTTLAMTTTTKTFIS